MKVLWLVTLTVSLSLSACGGRFDYDPPPDVELAEDADGIRTLGEPLVLVFSEPVDPETLAVAVWRKSDLDVELELPDAPELALIERCQPSTCPEQTACGGLASLCIEEDGLSASLSFNEAFESELATLLLLVIEPGLSDLAGNDRGTATQLPFVISPAAPTEPVENTGVDVTLNSGVMSLISPLADGNEKIQEIYPSLYLRLLVDTIVAAETGEVWFLATVARLHDDVKETNATSEVPTDRDPILDDEGWAVLITGTLSEGDEDGAYNLETVPITLTVWVLGTIEVILVDFQLRGILQTGAGEGGRDRMEGTLVATEASVTLGAPSPLGSVETFFIGDGLFPDEIAEDLPRLCSDSPCAVLEANGGDCQLAADWSQPTSCP